VQNAYGNAFFWFLFYLDVVPSTDVDESAVKLVRKVEAVSLAVAPAEKQEQQAVIE
jgi:hypothetical protein